VIKRLDWEQLASYKAAFTVEEMDLFGHFTLRIVMVSWRQKQQISTDHDLQQVKFWLVFR